MATLLIIISLALAVFGLYKYMLLRSMYYSNIALSKFRSVRFEATNYLAENVKEKLSIGDSEQYLFFIKAMDSSVNNFEEMRIVLPRLQSVKIVLKRLMKSSNTIEKVEQHRIEVIDKNFGRFIDGYIAAYDLACKSIPLFQMRVVLILSKPVLEFLTKLGLKKFKSDLNSVNYYLSKSDEYGHHRHHQMMEC